MSERAKLGYCSDCPVARVINAIVTEQLDDAPADSLDANTATIISFPNNLTDKELDDAAKAFSMTDREAFQGGVSKINLENMRTATKDALLQLGGYALESECTQPKEIGSGRLGCQAVGSAIAYERVMMAMEKYILGFDN